MANLDSTTRTQTQAAFGSLQKYVNTNTNAEAFEAVQKALAALAAVLGLDDQSAF
ncbi:MAG: hypothetical protein ACLQOO_02565 [Terriglobia bacterium]